MQIVLKNTNHGPSGCFISFFSLQRAEGHQQEVQMLTKQLEKQYHHCEETAGESSDTEEKYKEQKRPLKSLKGKIAINDLFPGRLDLDTNKVRISWSIRHFFDNENDHLLLYYLMFKAVNAICTFLSIRKGRKICYKLLNILIVSKSLSLLHISHFSTVHTWYLL